MAGRRLELPWLSGAVVRKGAELGIPTPANAFVCKALKHDVMGAEADVQRPASVCKRMLDGPGVGMKAHHFSRLQPPLGRPDATEDNGRMFWFIWKKLLGSYFVLIC